jgi:formylmethanofuran dehydrogenase subunit E
MRQLWTELSFETLDKPEEELLDVAEAPFELPEFAPIFDSAVCSVCGEEFMETRGAVLTGKAACMRCAGSDVFAVTGRGGTVLPGGKFR